MKRILIKSLSLVAIILMILGYNTILQLRSDAREIARLIFELEQAGGVSKAQDDTVYFEMEDGVFTGTGHGFGGDICVDVTVQDGRITQIDIVSAELEDALYLMLAQSVTERILIEQSMMVDTVSGATFSSAGIIQAVQDALTERDE